MLEWFLEFELGICIAMEPLNLQRENEYGVLGERDKPPGLERVFRGLIHRPHGVSGNAFDNDIEPW